MQQLLKCFKENNYVLKYRMVGDSKTIHDMFLAYPKSLKLFNKVSTIFYGFHLKN